jgi:bacteriophage N4 adsorption protein B
VDAVVAAILWPITIWILFSGFDDLLVDIVAGFAALRGRARKDRPSRRTLLSQPQQPIAILVPLWREDAVIARMVQQNTASILYNNYQIFIGAYPNDQLTLNEIHLPARRTHL